MAGPGKIYALPGGRASVGMAAGAVFAALALGTALLWACSSAPVKVECQQLRARIEYESMSEDQLRFAKQELEDCEDRLHAAQQKDSLSVDATEKRFTPKDSE